MQSYNNSFGIPLMILFFVTGILVSVGSAIPADFFDSQYVGSVSIVDIDHNTSVQDVSSVMNEFVVIRTLTPASVEIEVGDVVTWNNLQRPKKPIVVVSDDGLWEPQTIYYGKMFNYTFDEPGNYTFILEGTNITGIVVVTEVSTASVPESLEEAVPLPVPAPSPVMVQDGTKEKIQERAEGTFQAATPTNKFLMLRTITPTSMEVQPGETVIWYNLHRQKMPIVIISKEGLWKPQTIYYGKVFTYTFDKTGTYTFMLEDTQISGTIVVK